MSCVASTYLYGAFDCMFLSCDIRRVWLNSWVFLYELSGCGFESLCNHLNFKYRACFEEGVPWNSRKYRVWILSEMRTWHDKNMRSNYVDIFRIIRPEIFCKIDVLKDFVNFTGKPLLLESHFQQDSRLGLHLYYKRDCSRGSKFLKTPFL